MQKEFVISVDLDDELLSTLDYLRWNHIDINKLLEEELAEQIKEVIQMYSEVSI